MIDVTLPAASSGSLARGFAACIASVTEVSVHDVPLPDDDLSHVIGACRTWLAEHGLGLVPIADPASFQWPGWWIAIAQDPATATATSDSDDEMCAVLAFGTPPGVVMSPQDLALVGCATADLSIHAGYAVASLDPTIAPQFESVPHLRGTVEGIAIAPAAESDMRLVDVAHARAGRGLDGDRYAAGVGTFTPQGVKRPGYDLTLIAAEVLDELQDAFDIDLASTRRNILTRGIDVNALVGRTFRIGDVECRGRRLCEPCAHLENLSGPGHLRPLIHRGGLRADIITDGEISIGATIQLT